MIKFLYDKFDRTAPWSDPPAARIRAGLMKKTVYYKDLLHDDFSSTNGKIETDKITAKFPYEHSKAWVFFSGIVYYVIVFPLVFLIMKLKYGLRIRNRKALRKLPSGAFIYGNHTNGFPDAVVPSLLSFPKRAFVVTGPEAVSIKGIRVLVEMLGAVPLPSSFPGWKKFMNSIKEKTEKHTVMIYPEAHIWPYYTGIRPFGESSFKYPFQMNRKVVANVITYRQRKIFKNARPLVTATLSDPFDPADYASPKALRDAVFKFMCEVAAKDNYAYWTYLPENEEQAGS